MCSRQGTYTGEIRTCLQLKWSIHIKIGIRFLPRLLPLLPNQSWFACPLWLVKQQVGTFASFNHTQPRLKFWMTDTICMSMDSSTVCLSGWQRVLVITCGKYGLICIYTFDVNKVKWTVNGLIEIAKEESQEGRWRMELGKTWHSCANKKWHAVVRKT